jgi:hypothetical protein
MFLLGSDDLFVRGNQSEAAIWFLIAAVFLWSAWRQRGDARRLCVVATATFLLFGISDLVEIRTGAWWRPWWLLVWKGACILAMIWLLWADKRRRTVDATSSQRSD